MEKMNYFKRDLYDINLSAEFIFCILQLLKLCKKFSNCLIKFYSWKKMIPYTNLLLFLKFLYKTIVCVRRIVILYRGDRTGGVGAGWHMPHHFPRICYIVPPFFGKTLAKLTGVPPLFETFHHCCIVILSRRTTFRWITTIWDYTYQNLSILLCTLSPMNFFSTLHFTISSHT